MTQRFVKNGLYSIPYIDCNQEFIGQTKRQFRTRLKRVFELQLGVKNRLFFLLKTTVLTQSCNLP